MRFLLFFLIFVLYSCNNTEISDSIVARLDNDDNVKAICLSDFVKFNWDRMYIYPEFYSPDDISKDIGIVYTDGYVKEGVYMLLFTYRNSIVHKEDIPKLNNKQSFVSFKDIRFILKDNDTLFVEKTKLYDSCDKCKMFILTQR